ncbi:MAG: Nramp family divalent metal transporter [Candidatus Sericytochromatia bacterium]|nr:Nramp family divalent metal transporter [Candidatus Sericytochromatia bacterium]
MIKKIIEKIFSTPAQALEAVIEDTEKVVKSISEQKPIKKIEEYWNTLGPGLITGASDDDPSGIATYSQTGAQYGFQLIWLALFTFPLMAIVQEMCARIGLVSGRGLASNIRIHYPEWVLYTCTLLLFIANTFNIGADLGAMAKATQLLFPQINFSLLVISFTLICLGLQIFTTYAVYSKYLKWLTMTLLAYVVTAFFVKIDWFDVIKHTLIPNLSFSKDQIILICAILGTTISPYLFFWQTSQEVEEDILKGKTTVKLRQGATDQEIKQMKKDVWSGMFLSNLVMFFIIATCSATLFAEGKTDIQTAADAAKALKPLAGESAYLLFAVGIIGTGFLAIPVLSGSSSYAISESFGWKNGLFLKLKDAYPFYGVIIVSMIIGLTLNFIGLDPIKALIYSAVANGVVAPPVLILILLISNNKNIMGERTNGKFTNILGWIITLIMTAAGIAAIISLFK